MIIIQVSFTITNTKKLTCKCKQALVVWELDNAIHLTNCYPHKQTLQAQCLIYAVDSKKFSPLTPLVRQFKSNYMYF